ncbi:MAG: acyl--CoA ligase [Actinomycetota bacterium]|nr:acyl--CoA ligase [Actinomycetota bacterium]
MTIVDTPGGLLRVTRQPWLGADVLSYPDRPPTVVDVLHQAATVYADRVALVADGRTVGYREFAELVQGAVERLREEGVRPGDRVAVALPNGLHLAVALFACARGGFVMVGLNVRLRAPQWAYMLRHSRAVFALAADDLAPRLRRAAQEAGLPASAVREVGEHLVGRRRPWSYSPAQRPAEDATFAVVYTSGTTGRPKASQVVHRCSVHSALSYVHLLGLDEADRTAVLFPLYYITGLHAHVLPMMMVGGVSILVADASPREFTGILRDQRVTWMYTVPSFWLMLLREPTFCSPDLDHVRLGAFGGSSFPGYAVARIRERLPHIRLHDVYGLSETHSPATMLLDAEMTTRAGSVGRPLPCMEAVVVDDHSHQLPAGEAGELWLRGSLVTSGYLDDPVATKEAITDGWLRTGDIARLEEGYVYVLDRRKDMINRGGHKVFSVEIERLLLSHPAIADTAVVGVPARVASEVVACFVVPAEQRRVSAPEVRAWVRDRMADYAVPRHVRVVEDLPRNATGKVLKQRLRDRLLAELAPRG